MAKQPEEEYGERRYKLWDALANAGIPRDDIVGGSPRDPGPEYQKFHTVGMGQDFLEKHSPKILANLDNLRAAGMKVTVNHFGCGHSTVGSVERSNPVRRGIKENNYTQSKCGQCYRNQAEGRPGDFASGQETGRN
jgi:hypothetical protein